MCVENHYNTSIISYEKSWSHISETFWKNAGGLVLFRPGLPAANEHSNTFQLFPDWWWQPEGREGC